MFYRAFVTGIVLFWVGMTALLIRFEFVPGETRTLPVPVERVWKLLFEHEELSALTLFNGRQRLGEMNVQPHRLPPGSEAAQQLTVTGAFVLNLPLMPNERVVFHWTLDLSAHEEVQRLRLALTFHDPSQAMAGTAVIFEGQPSSGRWHYVVRQGNVVRLEKTGTIEELLDDPNLRAAGFDPKVLGQLGQGPGSAATITARHGTLHVNGEDLETYVLTIRQGDGPESFVYLNQLGRILAVKTFFGYDLYDNAFTP